MRLCVCAYEEDGARIAYTRLELPTHIHGPYGGQGALFRDPVTDEVYDVSVEIRKVGTLA